MNKTNYARRNFLKTTAAMGAVAMTPQEIFAGDASHNELTQRRPDPKTQPNQTLQAIAYGLHAPNPHNTQAWKFKIISDAEFLLYIDEAKTLPMTDPTTRQIHMGCGAFLEAMEVGVSQELLKAKVTVFPEGTAQVGEPEKPIALVSLVNSKVPAHPLAPYVRTRMTSRLNYLSGLLQSEFDSVLKSLPQIKSGVHFFSEEIESLNELKSALKEAFLVEMKTERTSDESRTWFRASQSEIEKMRDGLNLPSAGTTGFKRWFLENFVNFTTKKEWHSDRSIKIATEKINEAVDATVSFVTLRTVGNKVEDWIQAGRDYFLLQTAFFEKGYYFHPLSQALQEYPEVQFLQNKLNLLLKNTGSEKIQMIVRVGKSKNPWMSYRKSPESFIKKSTPI